jgi:hypothetical protein
MTLILLATWFIAEIISSTLKMEAMWSSETSDDTNSACHLHASRFLAELISSTLKMEAICSSETSVDTNSACHLLVSWFLAEIISSTLKMKAICSETSVDTKRTILRYIPEDGTLHNHRCENVNAAMLWGVVFTSLSW